MEGTWRRISEEAQAYNPTADAHKASAKIRGEFSDRDGQAAAKGEQAVDRGQAYLNQAENKLSNAVSSNITGI